MTKGLIVFSLLLFQLVAMAQEDAWVYLIDKENIAQALANPASILSEKAIDRKNRHGIAIDERDVPVNENYISQIKAAPGIAVLAKSKWMNALHVRGSQSDIENLQDNFSFVESIEFADRNKNASKGEEVKQKRKTETVLTAFNYGKALNQIEMINGDQLHLSDYTGTGVTIAVLDGGFPNVNTMAALQRLRDAGNLKGAYDFVNRDDDVYTNTAGNHGTLVLSTMAAYLEGQYVGTAPDASYYLFTTEDGTSENTVEESYWVEAAERADSLGVDVINSSLGYGKTYDNPNYAYSPSDFNGNTTFVSRGANIAFEKGLLIVNSAGNSGNNGVGAPADSPGVLSIGAVDANGNYASFSSVGNSFQPSQKPDVVAQGQNSVVINENDAIGPANGTSFSSPILAGGIACLWQALPNKTNVELMQLIRESASQFENPDNFLGYGIPNLEVALSSALEITGLSNETPIKMFPNPATNELFFSFNKNATFYVDVFDVYGKHVLAFILTDSKFKVNIASLTNGVYFVNLQSSNESRTFKLIKR
ncbi:S8 family serine peptidase [Tamlana crocina]|uniref:S8 family serine peptidase n=1 Tax=Tamlana crocina TaxID=393006 RepID=A0ABX1DDA2_9FLAO|nr:S8 family serine peptidase [Tamlana crocina]NJX14266.1 S8 family serine peptidase [Tamlana crocina]